MRKQQPQNRPFGPDDYNEATEPLPAVDSPFYQGTADGAYAVPTVPAPQQGLILPPPDPAQAYPVYQAPPSAYPVYQQPSAAYPVLPPPLPPKRQRGTPPGGSAYDYERPARRQRRRSAIPGLVRFFLVLVQLTLLARAICMLFGVQNTALWLSLLFSAGDLFVQPVRLLAANINLSILAGTQLLVYLEFLVAILAYGLLSRVLTILLRALFD